MSKIQPLANSRQFCHRLGKPSSALGKKLRDYKPQHGEVVQAVVSW